jgi:hypothetical protein
MTNFTVVFHSDPSHGWGQIPLSLVSEFGIADKISRYSYKDAHSAYLEEDCDLGLFLRVAEDKGWKIDFKDRTTNYDHPIRNYSRFTNKGD